MKKASLIASAAAASLTLAAVPVFAQGGPFADVPTDHWAYSAVDKLQKQGIVIGYPDGTYGGKRQMTRYEFAIAIARLLDKLPTATSAPPVDLSDYVKKEDLAGLAKQSDVDTLRKLVQEFQTELTTLGVDLDAVKKRLDALDARVKALEDAQKRVVFNGTVSAYGRANNRFKTDIGNGKSAQSVRDASGFEVTRGFGSKGSLLSDARVFNDIDLGITARLNEKTRAEATVNFGNYLNFLNSISSGAGFRSDRAAVGAYPGQTVNQDQDQTVYKAELIGDINWLHWEAGRMPTQFTPYTLKLIDVDYYTYNEKTDSGNIPLDGGQLSFGSGKFKILGLAAKVDPIKYVSNISGTTFSTQSTGYGLYAGAGHGAYTGLGGHGGLQAGAFSSIAPDGFAFGTGNRPTGSLIRPQGSTDAGGGAPMGNGAMPVEQLGGGRVSYGDATSALVIGATYLAFSGPSASAPVANDGSIFDKASFNRVFVYGADASWLIGKNFQINGEYSKSDTGGESIQNGQINTDTKKKITSKNDAIDAAAKLIFGAFEVGGGYRHIAPYFAAPGYWLRLGSLYNPVDIDGPFGRIAYTFNKKGANLFGEVHDYKGTGDAVDNGGLSKDDKLTNYRVGINAGLGSLSNVLLGYERTEYNVSAFTGGRVKPTESFINLGAGYKTSNNSNVSVLYQIIQYDDKDSHFDFNNGDGGVLSTQFQLKF